ncbi:hypothetical protein ACNKHM_23150 [Shigella sonnei]
MVSKRSCCLVCHACDPLWLLYYGSADEYFTYALLFLRYFAARRKLDFYYVTAYIYVDKSPRAYAYRRAEPVALAARASAVCSAIVLAV